MSPVIGVILMLAITVILSSVLGAFVLETERVLVRDSPQAVLAVDDMAANYDTSDSDAEQFLRIEFEDGEQMDLNYVKITVRRDDTGKLVADWEDGFTANTIGDWTATLNGNTLSASQRFRAGDVIEFTVEDASGVPADDTMYRITVIHTKTETTIFETTTRVK